MIIKILGFLIILLNTWVGPYCYSLTQVGYMEFSIIITMVLFYLLGLTFVLSED
jgi:hypothetical protein